MTEREKVMSNFRRMIELTDKAAREEFEEYYIVSKSRMDNYISCLEQGAESIKNLKAEIALYSERDKQMREALEVAYDLLTSVTGHKVSIGSIDNCYQANLYVTSVDEAIRKIKQAKEGK